MKQNHQYKSKQHLLIITLFLAVGLIVAACGPTQTEPQTYTIGVVSYVEALDPALDGLKAGMAERDYVEGETIEYIYPGVTAEDEAALTAAVQALLDQEVDLIYSLGTLPTKIAQQVTDDTDIPIVFVGPSDPLGDGLIDSIRQPGHKTTGIPIGSETALSDGRRLKWLVKMKPDIKQVFVPYKPDDEGMVASLKAIEKAAQALDVEIITQAVSTPEEAEAFIQNFPEDIDAFILLADRRLGRHIPALVELSLERKFLFSVPLVSLTAAGPVMGFGSDITLMGQQAASQVDQIFKGADAGDLPVEQPEMVLNVNLKTAGAIGVEIPDEVLRAAYEIIR